MNMCDPPAQLPAYVLSGIREQHLWYLRQCIDLTKLSSSVREGARVGCILLRRRYILERALQDPLFKPSLSDEECAVTALLRPGRSISSNAFDDIILSTGFTHQPPLQAAPAEECCVESARREFQESSEMSQSVRNDEGETVLYVSLEPTAEPSSGDLSPAQKIVQTRQNPELQEQALSIDRVYYGASRPQDFTGQRAGQEVMITGSVKCERVTGLEDDALHVAFTDLDNISVILCQDRSSQDDDDLPTQPRNPHKRMWEEPLI